VPAAKEKPIAGLHVRPGSVHCDRLTSTFDMSTHVCLDSMGPVIGRPFACHSSLALSNWRRPLISVAFMSSGLSGREQSARFVDYRQLG
jgi:hypothetical protein